MSNKRINLLVIPDLFPRHQGDLRGIFIMDYLRCLQQCDITVLSMNLTGKKVGLETEQLNEHIHVKRYTVSGGQRTRLNKPFLYSKYFQKGTEIGCGCTPVDLIHAHGCVLSGTLAMKLSKKLKAPYIVTEHTGPFSVISDSRLKLRSAKKALEGAAAVLTVSQHLANEISKSAITPKKMLVTGNPVDTNIFKPSPTEGTNKRILFASRLDEFKGGLRTLKAFHKVSAELPGWKLCIVGEGEEAKAIENYIEENTLSHTVDRKGYLPKEELAAEMQRADFFVFPSLHESFGLVAAEAMSCGLPVVCTNATAPQEFINASSGILINPMDIDSIANAMKQMAGSLEKYDSHGIRTSIEDRFSFENFGNRLLSIYKEAIS